MQRPPERRLGHGSQGERAPTKATAEPAQVAPQTNQLRLQTGQPDNKGITDTGGGRFQHAARKPLARIARGWKPHDVTERLCVAPRCLFRGGTTQKGLGSGVSPPRGAGRSRNQRHRKRIGDNSSNRSSNSNRNSNRCSSNQKRSAPSRKNLQGGSNSRLYMDFGTRERCRHAVVPLKIFHRGDRKMALPRPSVRSPTDWH
mmetsp:Transcript_23279/g.49582  ORF Transcript_23279/g.49582 Transcript_23279/m.49582 type:complete len:201 (-) Transcript_23279:1615-2217(-)